MRKVIIPLLATAALIGTCASSAAGAARTYDPSQKGPFEIGFTSYVIVDPTRSGDGTVYPHRPIVVYVWYPVDPQTITGSTPQASYPLDALYNVLPSVNSSHFEKYGVDHAYQEPAASSKKPFPVLMFSPGWTIPPWMHASLGTRLASHGFVVAALYHFGDQWWPWEPPLDHIAVASFNRPRDLSFALTDLLKKNVTAGYLLQGTVSPDKIAAGGWSLGGYAAMTLTGGDDSVCDTLYGFDVVDPPSWTCAPSSPDARIKTLVALDGSGWILRFDELARIKVPVIGIGQEWSGLAKQVELGWLPPGYESWGARQHAAYQGHPAYRVDIFNTNHFSYSDLCDDIQLLGDVNVWDPDTVAFLTSVFDCLAVTPPAVVHRLAYQYAIAFLKTQLAGEPGYQNVLTPGWALTREQLAEFFVTEKRNPNSIDEDWPGFFIYFKHQSGSEQARAEKDPTARPPIPRPGSPY